MARKTKLTPETQEAICQRVTLGATIPAACKASGVSWNTAKDWLRRGREGKQPYAAFVEAIDEAKAKWEVASNLVITKAAKKGDWKAAAWALERRVRAYAPPTQRVDIEVKSAEWLRVTLQRVRARAGKSEFKHLTKEAVDELLALLAGGK